MQTGKRSLNIRLEIHLPSYTWHTKYAAYNQLVDAQVLRLDPQALPTALTRIHMYAHYIYLV